MRVGVMGASGRMGKAVVRLAKERGLEIVAAVDTGDVGRDAGEVAGVAAIGVKVMSELAEIARAKADVVIDFSAPSVTASLARSASDAGVAIVSGTTGLDDVAIAALSEAATKVPVMWEPNMSLGVMVLGELVRKAITMLGVSFDVEIVEAHHRLKVDAPSGTATRLAEIAASARPWPVAYVHGREGKPGVRPSTDIGVLALRGGDVIGDHTVHLMGIGERIELTHRATNRDLFAVGAVQAAERLVGRKPGRYALSQLFDA